MLYLHTVGLNVFCVFCNLASPFTDQERSTPVCLSAKAFDALLTNHMTVRKTHPGSWILVGTGFKQVVIWRTLFYRDYTGVLSSFFLPVQRVQWEPDRRGGHWCVWSRSGAELQCLFGSSHPSHCPSYLNLEKTMDRQKNRVRGDDKERDKLRTFHLLKFDTA